MNALKTHNVDDLLRSYFRAEMPEPWPEMRAPAPILPLAAPAQRKTWWRRAGRLAIAASVALMLIGYLALASLFPAPTSKGLGVFHDNDTARNPVPIRVDRVGPKTFIFTPAEKE
jgi:hypothetical protein